MTTPQSAMNNEATVDQCIELAAALEQRRAVEIVKAVAQVAAARLQSGAYRSGYEMACEEIDYRLRNEVTPHCLPPMGMDSPDDSAQRAPQAGGSAGDEVAAWVNGDELDNLLDDRSATIEGRRSGWRGTPLYRRPVARTPPREATPQSVQAGIGVEQIDAVARQLFGPELGTWFEAWCKDVGRPFARALLSSPEATVKESSVVQAGVVSPLEVIAAQIQFWLDYQEQQGPVDDDTVLRTPPVSPTRGVLKNWVKAIRYAAMKQESTHE